MTTSTYRLPGIRSTPAPAPPAPPPAPSPPRDEYAETFAHWLRLARDFTAARMHAEFFAQYPNNTTTRKV